MNSSFISAAWHAGMTFPGSADDLCVAMGAPTRILTTSKLHEVPLLVEQAHQLAVSGLYVVGGLSYEAASAFDDSLATQHSADIPLLEFHAFKPGQVERVKRDQLSRLDPDTQFSPWRDDQSLKGFQDIFSEVHKAIAEGQFYQINLTTRLKAVRVPIDAWAFFQHLYLAQPAPQSLFLRGKSFNIMSLSPELFFQWDGVQLHTAPMKGTRQPIDGAFDVLSDSEKDRAENVMIVDLLRNDLAKVCKPRSVQVRSLFDVMHLPTVDQMTSSIVGQTLPGTRLVDVFAALFPCGSVTGAPKAQAMLRISQWETAPRKFYCGALGVLNPGGSAHFNVPIRTVIEQGQLLEYGVGSGITWYSTPTDEKKEWWQKTTFLRNATCDFKLLETLGLVQGNWTFLDDHLQRMKLAANHFSFHYDEPAIRAVLESVAASRPNGHYRGRCLLTAQGDFSVEMHDFDPHEGVVVLRLADSPMLCGRDFILHKTTHRPEYSSFQEQAAGAFDVLLFNQYGHLTETCRCNLLLKINGEWLTPEICEHTSTYLLPGVLRGRLLMENTIRECALTLKDLQRAEQVCLINSLRGWVQVSAVLDKDDQLLFSHNQ